MIFAPILLLLVLAFVAFGVVAYYVLPGNLHADLLFSVAVSPTHCGSSEASQILRRYRFAVIVHALVAVALTVAAIRMRSVIGIGVGLLWQTCGILIAFVSARNANLRFSIKAPSVREASLAVRGSCVEDRFWVQALPFAPLIATAIALGILWRTLADRMPFHRGVAGEPNGWTLKFPPVILAVLAIGFILCFLLALISYGLVHWSRQIYTGKPHPALRSSHRLTPIRIVLISQCLVATTFSVLGTVPLMETRAPARVISLLPWGILAFSVLILYWCLVIALQWPINPDGSALSVERYFEFGDTLNLRRPAAWLLMSAVIVVPALLAAVLLERP